MDNIHDLEARVDEICQKITLIEEEFREKLEIAKEELGKAELKIKNYYNEKEKEFRKNHEVIYQIYCEREKPENYAVTKKTMGYFNTLENAEKVKGGRTCGYSWGDSKWNYKIIATPISEINKPFLQELNKQPGGFPIEDPDW